jgi:hypothetical protein
MVFKQQNDMFYDVSLYPPNKKAPHLRILLKFREDKFFENLISQILTNYDLIDFFLSSLLLPLMVGLII